MSTQRSTSHSSPVSVGSFKARTGIRPLTPTESQAADAFHRAYYEAWSGGRPDGLGTLDLSWFGYRTLKCPFDLWTYQEILVETQPDLLIECGTRYGGSALFLASMFDLLGRGRVVTVDIEAAPDRPVHARIEYVAGSSIDPAVLARVRESARGQRTMVLLDADHTAAHVRAELAAYSDLVTVGCYLIVEDTNVNGHPILPDFGPGPMEAVDAFLQTTHEFVIDRDRERFMVSLNPRGFLRRVR